MSDLKCKICGGELIINQNDNSGCCKSCGAKTVVITNAMGTGSSESTANVSNLVKRIFLFLEDGDFKSAYEYCEKLLDINVECAEAYLGKLMAEFEARNQADLQNLKIPFDESPNYQKILRFGNEDLKKTLEEYINHINSRNECERQEEIYTSAMSLMTNPKTAEDYRKASKFFEFIPDYKDSSSLTKKCLEYAENTETAEKENKERNKKKILKFSIIGISVLIIAICGFAISRDTEHELLKKEMAKAREEITKYSDYIRTTSHNVVGLKSNGTVVASGWNQWGQCDVEDWNDITKISVGPASLTLGLKTDGTVVTNYINAVDDWTDIVALSAGSDHIAGLNSTGTLTVWDRYNDYWKNNTDNWSNIVALSSSHWHLVGLRSDGTVVATGSNEFGQCDVMGWNDIIAISAGGDLTAGLKKDGTVITAGIQIRDNKKFKDIIAITTGEYYVVGLKSDGTVVATGNNDYGQCDVKDWNHIVAISAGFHHTVGLKSNGTVVATGNNDYGQCDVKDWKDIVAIFAEHNHTIGLKSDGTVVAVGNNEWNQLDVEDWDLF